MKTCSRNMSAALFVVAFSGVAIANANDEAVKRLERMAASYQGLIDAKEPVISPPGASGDDQWYRRKAVVSDVSFDARKTDSLVSPLAGEISYTCGVRGAKGASEQAVMVGGDNFNIPAAAKCRATYAYQSSKWINKSVSCQGLIGNVGPWVEVNRPSQGVLYSCAQALPKE